MKGSMPPAMSGFGTWVALERAMLQCQKFLEVPAAL